MLVTASPGAAAEQLTSDADEPTLNPSTPTADAPASAADASATSLSPTAPAADEPTTPSATDDPPPVRTPTPILRDDLRPQTRPEDFLPFFQIPAPGSDADVIVPTPRTPVGTPLPPSSATYTQTPR